MTKKRKTPSKKGTAIKKNTGPKKGPLIKETNSKASVESLTKLYSRDIIYYHLFVNDFEKMKEFYKNILELEPAGEAPPEYGWCDFYLPVKGARLGLFKTDKELVNTEAAPSLNISVNNIEQAYHTLKAKQIQITEIQDIPDMISMFDFRDPEGNRISILGIPRIKTK